MLKWKGLGGSIELHPTGKATAATLSRYRFLKRCSLNIPLTLTNYWINSSSKCPPSMTSVSRFLRLPKESGITLTDSDNFILKYLKWIIVSMLLGMEWSTIHSK
jgi:hypothetical protein